MSDTRPTLFHTLWECGDGTWGHGVALHPMSEQFFWAKTGFASEDDAARATNPQPEGYVVIHDIPANSGRIETLNMVADRIEQDRAKAGDDLFSWADD